MDKVEITADKKHYPAWNMAWLCCHKCLDSKLMSWTTDQIVIHRCGESFLVASKARDNNDG